MFRWIRTLFRRPSDEDRGEYTVVRIQITEPPYSGSHSSSASLASWACWRPSSTCRIISR
jgi:hypothetical protein